MKNFLVIFTIMVLVVGCSTLSDKDRKAVEDAIDVIEAVDTVIDKDN